MSTSASSASEWPDTPVNSHPLIWPNLLSIAENPDLFAWEFFRPGVDIYRLYGDGQTGAAAALLKYAPGAKIPDHEHTGYEHIIVLSGSQQDHLGDHKAGTLVINQPGTRHNVASEQGCVVLIIWEKPVQMIPPDTLEANG